MSARPLVLGIDFDNTIVSYEELMFSLALKRGLVDKFVSKNKKDIRDAIRQKPNGEIEWQKIQADCYGKQMMDAQLIDGVKDFFVLCHEKKIPIYIISHKSIYAAQDIGGVNLREAAIAWMQANHFFRARGLHVRKENVHFASTREEKANFVRDLKCTHFIDDLEETFLEAFFPENVEKILFAPGRMTSLTTPMKVMSNWKDIREYFFRTKQR